MKNQYIALVPAYEPGIVLLDVLRGLREQEMEILVVDDGSGLAFSDRFENAAFFAEVLRFPENKGKGAALKAGLAHIRDTYPSDYTVVTVDADGQHRPEDALRLCRLAKEHPDTLILGSRRLKEHVPLRSQFGNTVTRFVYRLSTGLWIHDTQTGLRAFDSRLIPELLAVSGERYEYEMNVLLEFARKKIPIQETGIDTIYFDNNAASHFDTLRDSVRIYKEILKFSASSFAGFLVDYTLYGLLLLLTGNLRAANIGARIVSASVNYTLNRKFVFKSRNSLANSAFQYVLLAAAILLGNTLLLEWLVTACKIHQMAAKILTELFFFIFSWLVQRTIIFRRKET